MEINSSFDKVNLMLKGALVKFNKVIAILLLSVSIINISHAANYVIDSSKTNVRFAINNIKSSGTSGGFYDVKGQLQYDPSAKTGDISLSIPIKSLNTGNPSFNQRLMSAEFFDMAQFPSASFDSTKWHFTGSNNSPQLTRVDGNLTLHGVTRAISLTATKFNCSNSSTSNKSVCTGNFTTTIDRTKWNINKFTLFGLTKNLTLNIQVEAVKM